MKSFLKYNWAYLAVYVITLLLLAFVLLSNGKVQIHKATNQYVGNFIIDEFFKYVTHLGDGIFAILIALVLLFYSIKKSLYIFLSYVFAGLISYILKHHIYYDIYRPHFVFKYYVRETFNQVAGEDLMGFHSFPSGHALSAFALFFCLLFITKKQYLKSIFIILAYIAAFSRVYLSQHWLIDIYVGSIIGTCSAILFYFMFYTNNYFNKLDKPIFKLKRTPSV